MSTVSNLLEPRCDRRSWEIGSSVGKYLLTEKLGQGSWGMVFRAVHQGLNHSVAIKVLRPMFDEGPSRAEAYLRLQSEARLLAQINHPNIIRLLDFEDDPDSPYLIVEYVEGLNLEQLISQSGRLQPNRVVRLGSQIAAGLAAAHEVGIIHRDLKPANVLLTKDGTPKIADLGQATLLSDQKPGDEIQSGLCEAIVGTVAYMAPEQILDAKRADHRSDMYALGALLYHAIVGKMPFTGQTRSAVLMKHLKSPIEPAHLNVPGLSMPISEMLQTLLAKNPDDRYQSYRELIEVLDVLQEEAGPVTSTRPPSTAVLALVETECTTGEHSVRRTRDEEKKVWAKKALYEGIALAKASRTEEARKLLLQVAEVKPGEEQVWLWLAAVAPSPSETATYLKQAVQINPENVAAVKWLANYEATTNTANGNRSVSGSSPVVPAKEETLTYSCPLCLAENQEPHDRCPACAAVISLASPDLILKNSGVNVQRMISAIQRLETIPLVKRDFQTHYFLGLAHLNLRQYDKVLEHFGTAARLRPNDSRFRAQVGAVLALGQTQSQKADNRPIVLVVDDSPTIRKAIAMVIEKEGYRVIPAADGYAGIELIKRDLPDLILLDINMPGMDGYQFCKLIKADRRMAQVPIVMLTGKEGFFDKLLGRLTGAAQYITKPCQSETLLSVLQKYCPKRAS